MLGTIDKAGRVVVPREIRHALGLTPGNVEITIQGTRVVIEQPGSRLREKGGHLLLPSGGSVMAADEARELRLADQR